MSTHSRSIDRSSSHPIAGHNPALPQPRPRTRPDTRVDWRSYAAVYDVMAEANPAYQALVDDYRAFVGRLRLRSGDVLVDVGAGTGNFALTAADAWPQCHVLHVDADDAMNHLARAVACALM